MHWGQWDCGGLLLSAPDRERHARRRCSRRRGRGGLPPRTGAGRQRPRGLWHGPGTHRFNCGGGQGSCILGPLCLRFLGARCQCTNWGVRRGGQAGPQGGCLGDGKAGRRFSRVERWSSGGCCAGGHHGRTGPRLMARPYFGAETRASESPDRSPGTSPRPWPKDSLELLPQPAPQQPPSSPWASEQGPIVYTLSPHSTPSTASGSQKKHTIQIPGLVPSQKPSYPPSAPYKPGQSTGGIAPTPSAASLTTDPPLPVGYQLPPNPRNVQELFSGFPPRVGHGLVSGDGFQSADNTPASSDRLQQLGGGETDQGEEVSRPGGRR